MSAAGVNHNVQHLLMIILLSGMLVGFGAQAGELPENNYKIHCQGCHLPDGAGKPPDVPAFSGQLTDFLRVEGGRAYLVQVPGTANAVLDNRSIAELLNWMVQRFNERKLPEGFIPYTEKEVARYRGEILVDPGARRAALLASLSVN